MEKDIEKDIENTDDEVVLLDENYQTMLRWNDPEVAFIKNDVSETEEKWGIYSADGIQLAVVDNREFAFVVARQNDLKPQSVH